MAINWKAPIIIRDHRNGNWFWIGKEIWQDSRLTSSDKVLYGTLAYFSNQHTQESYPSLETLQEFSCLSNRQAYRSIKKLEELDYISVERRHGKPNKYKMLQTPANLAPLPNNTGTPAKSHDLPLPNNTTNNNNINKNIINNTLSKDNGKTGYGNQEINQLTGYFLSAMGIPKEDISQRQSRQYWNLLLRESKTGVDGVKWLIDIAAGDEFYRNNITSSKDLYYKRVKLIARQRGNSSKIAVMPKRI